MAIAQVEMWIPLLEIRSAVSKPIWKARLAETLGDPIGFQTLFGTTPNHSLFLSFSRPLHVLHLSMTDFLRISRHRTMHVLLLVRG